MEALGASNLSTVKRVAWSCWVYANSFVRWQLKIVFGSAELARSYNSDTERLRIYGAGLAPVLRRRLGEIAAAGHLGELRSVPATELRVDPTGSGGPGDWLLVSLDRSADLRVRPRDDPAPVLADGRLDEVAVLDLLVGAVAMAR